MLVAVDSVADREARAADRILLADINAQIFDLERALSQLHMAKEPVQARLDAFRYPVLTLPTEIISEIFTQFIPDYPLCSPLSGPSSPTLLTHICCRWREIALGSPALWRAVDLQFDDEEIAVETQVCIANLWFERSQNRPLSIQIRGEDCNPEVAPLIEAVALHRARWEYLSIGLKKLQDHSDLENLSGPTPLLRSLLLKVDNLDPSVAVSWLNAPLLRNATLDDHGAQTLLLPWSQLTSLTLSWVYPSECTPVLRQTPFLVHCSLSLLGEPDGAVPSQMSLPHLESLAMLELMVEEELPVTEYLETFLVPALSRLEIPERFLGVDPIGCLHSFIGNSGCKLRDLVITTDNVASIDSYQSTFPSIHNLSFRQ
ncbi:hypothetical protein C8R46DRAFT_1243999 [Mycena filopes]|nr:hypothetical protein C8R46DRAFT_1243999 [Mycena filopes]